MRTLSQMQVDLLRLLPVPVPLFHLADQHRQSDCEFGHNVYGESKAVHHDTIRVGTFDVCASRVKRFASSMTDKVPYFGERGCSGSSAQASSYREANSSFAKRESRGSVISLNRRKSRKCERGCRNTMPYSISPPNMVYELRAGADEPTADPLLAGPHGRRQGFGWSSSGISPVSSRKSVT